MLSFINPDRFCDFITSQQREKYEGNTTKGLIYCFSLDARVSHYKQRGLALVPWSQIGQALSIDFLKN